MTADYPDLDGTQPCAKGDPDRFHPHPNTSAESQAKVAAECKPCPFLAPCREYALNTRVSGIWGGLTDDERTAIRRKKHIVPGRLMVPGLVHAAYKPRALETIPECGTTKGYWSHHTRKTKTCDACRAALAAERAGQRAKQKANGKAAS